MAWSNENSGRFLSPPPSLSTLKSTSRSSQGMPQTECQVCQGNSALIFPETGEDFLSWFWPAWKFGQSMAKWCCCSCFTLCVLYSFVFLFQFGICWFRKRTQWRIRLKIYSPIFTTNSYYPQPLQSNKSTEGIKWLMVRASGHVQTVVHNGSWKLQTSPLHKNALVLYHIVPRLERQPHLRNLVPNQQIVPVNPSPNPSYGGQWSWCLYLTNH